MSADDQGGAGRREVAYRLFASEFDDADFSYSESDEERAPNYVVTPTGARVNRVFVVGVLTSVEPASEDVLRARVVDPTGAFVVYAGQYQPDAQAFFDRAEPPAFVALTGKARTFQPEDSDVTYTSVRPENVNEVDAETRDRWTVQAARQTLARVGTMADALARDERGEDLRRALESEGVDVGLAAGIPLALDHYGTTPAYLESVRETAIQATEVVSGERDEVDPPTVSPDAPGDANLAKLTSLDLSGAVDGVSADEVGTESATDDIGAESATGDIGTESTADDEAEGTASDDGAATAASGETGASESESATTTAESASGSGNRSSPDEAGTDGSVAETESGAAATASETETDGESTSTAAADTATDTADSESTADEPEDGASAADTAETDTAESDDDLGDFEPGDFDPDEFDLDEEEREQIEEEYGTEFQTGTEVEEPGEAGIETPAPDSGPESEADATEADAGSEADAGDATPTAADPSSGSAAAETDDAEPATADSEEAETADAGAEETADTSDEEANASDEEADAGADEAAAEPTDVDLEDAVMEAMREHDEGGGASEATIVEAVASTHGFEESAVAEAIQDALMDGRCYEPEDGVYKPI